MNMKRRGSLWVNYNGSPTFLTIFALTTLAITTVWFSVIVVNWLIHNTTYGLEVIAVLGISAIISFFIWLTYE